MYGIRYIYLDLVNLSGIHAGIYINPMHPIGYIRFHRAERAGTGGVSSFVFFRLHGTSTQ